MRHGKRVLKNSRYVLDFRNPDVRPYPDQVIARLVNDYGVGCIKMDYNVDSLQGGRSHAAVASAGKPFAVGSVPAAFRSAGRAVIQPRSISTRSIWTNAGNKAVTMPLNSGASCVSNSFDYLVQLQRHAQELAACPTEWMPWNYRETLARDVPLPDSA